MEMDTDAPEAVQMDTNAYQENQVIKSKDAEAHTVDGETQLKQQGLDNTQNTKGEIQNGEYR